MIVLALPLISAGASAQVVAPSGTGPTRPGVYVELRADSQGAVMSVRDENNHPLVDFRASGNSLNLNIRDRQGRNLLRLLADSLGAALRVKH